jgi:hypothetical protein
LRPLPAVTTLQEAVEQVINSNQRDGYVPTRFIQATEYGHASNLRAACERLIQKGETLENLEDALRKFPTLLTLEDFVSRFGDGWGFSRTTVDIAKQRVAYFDQIAGDTRYS